MNWDDIEHRWPDLRGRVRRHWFRLREEDVNQINGDREQLIHRLQEHYQFTREEAEKEVDAWAFLLPS